MLLNQILRIAPPGTAIPKPSATGKYLVKGRGKRRGEDALVYFIPNRSDNDKPHEKGITASEFEQAYSRLNKTGLLTRKWFKNQLSACDAEGTCNFTTVGGIFTLMGEATYAGPGTYRKTNKSSGPAKG